MEHITNPPYPKFVFPRVERESGEIERVAAVFDHDPKEFGPAFCEVAERTDLVELSEDVWSHLENTDSFGIKVGDWNAVQEHAVDGHPEHHRDWNFHKTTMESGGDVEASIICKSGGIYHLVSGNTRLMVARALGVTPHVLIVDMS